MPPDRIEYTGTPTGGVPMLAVLIGASAGGPKAVQTILESLPADFSAPIAICQHMTHGATASWAQHLNDACKLRVSEATHAEQFRAGHVYIAPTGRHLRIRGTAAKPWCSLELDFADVLHVPSIDFLMSSAAETFGSRALGVLLSGMGSDGALGMLAIRRAGGVTLAESAESAFMPSMPRAAEDLGAVNEVVPIELMAFTIAERVAGRI